MPGGNFLRTKVELQRTLLDISWQNPTHEALIVSMEQACVAMIDLDGVHTHAISPLFGFSDSSTLEISAQICSTQIPTGN